MKKTSNDLIATGRMCPYCKKETQLVVCRNSKRWGCPVCHAMVFCHPGTERAMGMVASQHTRQCRKEAHFWLDALWKNKLKRSRYNTYSWLSLKLHKNKNDVHLALFNEEECREVVKICSDYIKAMRPELYERLYNQISRENIDHKR